MAYPISLNSRDYDMLVEVLDEALDNANNELAACSNQYGEHYKPHRIAAAHTMLSKTVYIRNLVEKWRTE